MSKPIRRRLAARLCVLGIGAFAAAASHAVESMQAYPARPVKVIVPTAPGGSIDMTARLVAERLAKIWGQAVVVDNRPGAEMRIGTEAVARAQPDGYTLIVVHDGAMSINAAVYAKLRYSPARDFEPISMVSSIPTVVLANPSFDVKTIRDLVALAKKKPGLLDHANGGPGTLLRSQLFKSAAGIDYLEVPYKGVALALASAVAGDTQFTTSDLASASGFIHSGRLRPIGLAAAERAPAFPDLPTMAESGVNAYQATMWIGAFAPAGTPKPIIDKISRDIQRVMRGEDIRAQMEKMYMTPIGSTSEELAGAMRRDTEIWKRLVQEKNLVIDQ